MTDIVNRSKEWGKGTDLYKALQVIENKYGTLLRPDTFLIILSDTKTLNYARAAEEMTKLRKKVKEIIWLNTLPKKSWDDTPSVQAFCARCLMYECNTLAHLERIMTSRMLK